MAGWGVTNNILASLFRKSRKKPIWTPKMTNEVAKAVRKATRLMPDDCSADPVPSGAVVVEVGAAPVAVVLVLAVVEDGNAVVSADVDAAVDARDDASVDANDDAKVVVLIIAPTFGCVRADRISCGRRIKP